MKQWHIIIPFVVAQFGFDFGDIGGSLEQIGSDIIGGVLSALSFLWSVLVGLGNYLLQALQALYAFFRTLMEDIKRAFVWLWEHGIKTLPGKIIGLVTKIKGILTTAFNILSQIIDQLRILIDYTYKHFIRPYLIMIQRVRQVLQLFRLLGFKWAARLDARLAALEAKIIGVFLTLRAPLNQAISFLGLIADPLGILRRNPVIGALLRNAPEIKNAIDRATAHPQTQAEVNASNRANGWFQPTAAAGNAQYFAQKQLPPDLAAARQEFLDAQAALPGLAKQELS